jgi:NitT/TauT family transport system permease protein
VLFVFGAAWQYASSHGMANPIMVGVPSKILVFFWNGLFVNHTLVADLIWTLAGTAAAFIVGSLGGMLVGFLFVAAPGFERFVDPFVAALNALPRIALAPLFILWFGLGISSKIALGASLTFFIVLSSTVAGIRSVERDLLTLSKTLGASPSQIFLRITLPSAVPTLFSGLRLGLIYALLGVIAGEIIAAQHGLGQSIAYLSGAFQIDGVFAVLLLLAILGSLITKILDLVERWLLRWQ